MSGTAPTAYADEALATAAGQTCDGCGPSVKAYVVVALTAGNLAFCAHHYNRLEVSGVEHRVLADDRAELLLAR